MHSVPIRHNFEAKPQHMKNLTNLMIAVPLAGILLTLTACPIGIDYSLGTPGTEKIDKSLIGTWTTSTPDAEVVKVRISKKDNYSYLVEILEKGEMYDLETDMLTAWVTELDGNKFLYAQEGGDSPSGPYYLYHYGFDNQKNLTLHDVSLLINGVDGITSTDAFREEVRQSLKKEGCLSEPRTYTGQ